MSFEFQANHENHVMGEPEWLPTVEEVARARARLAKLGVLEGLRRTRGLGSGWAPVAPGDTPWAWWSAAALWIILWPALIAFRYGLGRWDWLPWWLLPALAAAHMLALAAPVGLSALAMRGGSPALLRQRFGQVQTLADMLALEPDEFEAWTALLFQMMGYRVRNPRDTGDHGIDLLVYADALPLGLVQCKRYRGTVGEPTVRDLYGTLTGAGADHAWLVTTGAISRQAREWAAGKRMELWDGRELVTLARKYR